MFSCRWFFILTLLHLAKVPTHMSLCSLNDSGTGSTECVNWELQPGQLGVDISAPSHFGAPPPILTAKLQISEGDICDDI